MDLNILDLRKIKTVELQTNSVSQSAAEETNEIELSGITSSDTVICFAIYANMGEPQIIVLDQSSFY